MSPIDLRSDTVTRPTPAMRDAMARAEVGDDVYGEDPSVKRLEAEVAGLLGKEAALFVPSGTMGNQLALLCHTERGDEVYAGEGSHCIWYESGAAAAWSGVQLVEVGRGGIFDAEELERAIKPPAYYMPRPRLLVVENTHNRGGGRVWPLAQLGEVCDAARRRGLALHLDGARLWNASVASAESPATLARAFDSVSVCFSKGLGAPVGSALAGSKPLIEKAHRLRKMLGGGMRQVGVLAAAASYAIEHHIGPARARPRERARLRERARRAAWRRHPPGRDEHRHDRSADRCRACRATRRRARPAAQRFRPPPASRRHAPRRRRRRRGAGGEHLARAARPSGANRLVSSPLARSTAARPSRASALTRGTLALLLLASIGGCAPSYADGYLASLTRGLRAHREGRDEEARLAFDDAAALGDRYKDRAEALMLRARSEERLGRLDDAEATYRLVVDESRDRYHGVRAAFSLVRLAELRRSLDEVLVVLADTIAKYPESGLVRSSLRRGLARLDDERGTEVSLAWLEALAPRLRATAAEPVVDFERAGRLAELGRLAEAAALYVTMARAHPYPSGPLTDDAYYLAALLEERLGRPREAVQLLEEMLAPREAAYFGASYDRPRFPEGRLRLGLLHAGPLSDRARGKRELLRLAEEHPTSRLVDDALWLVARLEAEDGEQQRACSALARLVEVRESSRYLSCVHLVCTSAPARAGRPCPAYVERELAVEALGATAARVSPTSNQPSE
jgi:threonine aldolase